MITGFVWRANDVETDQVEKWEFNPMYLPWDMRFTICFMALSQLLTINVHLTQQWTWFVTSVWQSNLPEHKMIRFFTLMLGNAPYGFKELNSMVTATGGLMSPFPLRTNQQTTTTKLILFECWVIFFSNKSF